MIVGVARFSTCYPHISCLFRKFVENFVDNSLTISARYQVYFWREEKLHMKMSAPPGRRCSLLECLLNDQG